MRIFVSWSGEGSRRIAEALIDTLELAFDGVEAWFSVEMKKGSLWREELKSGLRGADRAVVCLTPKNLGSPWLNYEVGALAVQGIEVCPFLVGVSPADLASHPLGEFQQTRGSDQKEVARLFESIRVAGNLRSKAEAVRKRLESGWDRLQLVVRTVKDAASGAASLRSSREPRGNRLGLESSQIQILRLLESRGGSASRESLCQELDADKDQLCAEGKVLEKLGLVSIDQIFDLVGKLPGWALTPAGYRALADLRSAEG